MKVADMRKKKLADLEKDMLKLRTKLATAQRERFTTEERNVRKNRQDRKELAKLLTIMQEKQQHEEEDPAPEVKNKEKSDE